MERASGFRSAENRVAYCRLYDEALAASTVSVEECDVETSYGLTHVLKAGSPRQTAARGAPCQVVQFHHVASAPSGLGRHALRVLDRRRRRREQECRNQGAVVAGSGCFMVERSHHGAQHQPKPDRGRLDRHVDGDPLRHGEPDASRTTRLDLPCRDRFGTTSAMAVRGDDEVWRAAHTGATLRIRGLDGHALHRARLRRDPWQPVVEQFVTGVSGFRTRINEAKPTRCSIDRLAAIDLPVPGSSWRSRDSPRRPADGEPIQDPAAESPRRTHRGREPPCLHRPDRAGRRAAHGIPRTRDPRARPARSATNLDSFRWRVPASFRSHLALIQRGDVPCSIRQRSPAPALWDVRDRSDPRPPAAHNRDAERR